MVALVALLVVSLAACRPKDESALVFESDKGKINIRTALYLCFLIDADNAFRSEVDKIYAEKEKDVSKLDYLKEKIDNKDHNTWVKERALENAQVYSFIESEFARLGLKLAQTDIDELKQGVDSNWNGDASQYTAGISEFYTNNGVSYDTYYNYYQNNFKRSLVYDYYYGKEKEVLEKQDIKKELVKDIGSRRPNDAKIRTALEKNLLLINSVSFNFTDEQGTQITDAEKKKKKKQLDEMAKKFNAGEITFDKIKKELKVEAQENDQLLGSKKLNELFRQMDTADEYFDDVSKAKFNVAKVYESDSNYNLIIRKDILANNTYFNDYNYQIVTVLSSDEFNDWLKEEGKKLKFEENKGAIKYYAPKKIEYPTTATAAATEPVSE